MANEENHDAEVLPRREALSLINTDPSAYSGLLGSTPDPTAGSTHDLVDADAAASEEQAYSDEPQSVSTQDSQTASSQT